MSERCPRCNSPDPKLHPAVQFEGEVQPCAHLWHYPAGTKPAVSPASPVSASLADEFTKWVEQYALKVCPEGCLPTRGQEREINLFARVAIALRDGHAQDSRVHEAKALADRAEGCLNCRNSAYPSDVLRECITFLRGTSADTSTVRPEKTGKPRGAWPAPGDKMKFLGKNGYDHQLTEALGIFVIGNEYEVEDCDVGDWSHSIKFRGVSGRYNGVMFERVSDSSPTSNRKDE